MLMIKLKMNVYDNITKRQGRQAMPSSHPATTCGLIHTSHPVP